MIRFFVLSMFCCAVALVVVAPAGFAAHHEAGEAAAEAAPAAWDQAKVVELARAVQKGTDALRHSERKLGPGSLADGQSAVRLRYLDRLKLANREARRLADAVEGGQGRDDSLHSYMRLNKLLRDAAEEARRMFRPKAILSDIEAIAAQMDQLSLFYTGQTEARSPLHGPRQGE